MRPDELRELDMRLTSFAEMYAQAINARSLA